jgi:mannose-6-phosphate isomerase-like protein (cupin superfamily)
MRIQIRFLTYPLVVAVALLLLASRRFVYAQNSANRSQEGAAEPSQPPKAPRTNSQGDVYAPSADLFLPPEVAAELAKSPTPPTPNDIVGIDIDRYIGNPLMSSVRVAGGVIFQRSILQQGDPYRPGDPGAVLEYWKDFSIATILGQACTPLIQAQDEQFWYVESGKGRLDNGDGYWDLHEGIGVLIPPNARHRVMNTADEPIQMLMLTWSPGGTSPRTDILVRDVRALTVPAKGSHWNYFGTDFFSPEDGVGPNNTIAVVYMPPMTIAQPHAHIPHWAEVWTKLPPHSSFLMLGSEVREMPPNTAFLAPPNSLTTHSVVNLMKDQTQAWLYIGHAVWNQGPHPERPFVKPKLLKNLQ